MNPDEWNDWADKAGARRGTTADMLSIGVESDEYVQKIGSEYYVHKRGGNVLKLWENYREEKKQSEEAQLSSLQATQDGPREPLEEEGPPTPEGVGEVEALDGGGGYLTDEYDVLPIDGV